MLAGYFRRSQHGEIVNFLERRVAVALKGYAEFIGGGLLIGVARAVLHRAIRGRAGTEQGEGQEKTEINA